MKKNKDLIINIGSFLIALCVCIFIYACTVREYGFNILGLVVFIVSSLITILYFFKRKIFDNIIDFVIKFRYLIALIVFVICVLFKVSGSSIGTYDDVIPLKEDESVNYVIFGKSKPIRSDEWQIMTPYSFSQVYNDFKIDSEYLGLDGQNMIICFNSPVKDITILGKPLVWGYMLLGVEYGLSWYWCSKTILFILFGYEILYILTKNKKLSLFGSLLIILGPSTQWWFAPHMPDVVLWFMVLFTMVYYLFSSEKTWLKNLLVLLIPFVALEYVVALFPSFQVGFGYFLVIIFLAVMYRDGNKFYSKKENYIRVFIIGLASVGLIGYFLVNNMDALKLLNNTVYPGKRVSLGGFWSVKNLFTDLGTPFLGYTDTILYGNQCEDSTNIHFGMFFVMLFPVLYKLLKEKKDKDRIVGLFMTIIIGVYSIFLIIGFPTILAKITFFKYINRMDIILGFIFVIYTIWGINALIKVGNKVDKKYYLLAIFAYLIMNLSFINDSLKNYMPVYFYYIEIILFGVILLTMYYKEYRSLSYSLILGILIFSSISINPVIVGISAITNHPSTKFIQEKVKEDKDAYWIGYGQFGYSSYLISIGAKTANSITFYPDLKKWEIIDPDKKFEENWNRYGYVITNFVKDDNYVENSMTQDVVNLFINNKTVYDLGVKYILTSDLVDLSFFNDKEYNYDKIYSDGVVKVFQINKISNIENKKANEKNTK